MDGYSKQNEGIRILEDVLCQAIPDPSVLVGTSMRIEIDWPGISLRDFANELSRALPEEIRNSVALSVEPSQRRAGAREIEPTILGGTIHDAVRTLRPFFSALLSRVREHNYEAVVVTLPDKMTCELRTDAAMDQVNQIAAIVEAAGCARIEIVEQGQRHRGE